MRAPTLVAFKSLVTHTEPACLTHPFSIVSTNPLLRSRTARLSRLIVCPFLITSLELPQSFHLCTTRWCDLSPQHRRWSVCIVTRQRIRLEDLDYTVLMSQLECHSVYGMDSQNVVTALCPCPVLLMYVYRRSVCKLKYSSLYWSHYHC